MAMLLHIEALYDRDPLTIPDLERARDDFLFPLRVFY